MSTDVSPRAIDSFANLAGDLPPCHDWRFRGLNPELRAGALTEASWLGVSLVPSRDPWAWWAAVSVPGGEWVTRATPIQVDRLASALERMGAADCVLTAERPCPPASASPFGAPPRPAGPKRHGDRSVYFIQPVDGGRIKIGVSGNPEIRLRDLQTGSPVDLRIIALIPDAAPGTEPALHVRFAHARAHGEWFDPTPDLLDYIAEHAS